MKFQDLKNKAGEDLQALLASSVKELRGLRTQAKMNQLKQSHKMAILRKTIAQIKMILKV